MQSINQQKGESLIAVLIAAGIFAAGISVIVLLQGAILKNTGVSNQRILAMNVARNTLETLRGFQATGVKNFASIQNNGGVGISNGDVTKEGVKFTITWTAKDYYAEDDGDITTVPNANGVVQKQVKIKVSSGADEEVVLKAVICNC